MVVSGQVQASSVSFLVKALPLTTGSWIDPTADLNTRDMRTLCLFQESPLFVAPGRAQLLNWVTYSGFETATYDKQRLNVQNKSWSTGG
jgi:hypothetical protein